ncbi:hypothetical protein [Couchioplanes azureus]|uniref:hypothetical protein n=1 Tax=Couchioplanes caeruleus TaxID=56438 RepID=UPI001670E890|nr:hypothetical protein [Couchioplanes caeruleus]GGQ83820.1 hypothetical protein GCM10010166_62520 [Couchioplanes caeruleus subsp. azureus]
MTQPAQVASAADWADLVAALRNEIYLIEGFYDALTSEAENNTDANPTPAPAADRTPALEPEEHTPMTDRDLQAEHETEHEMREDYETDGELDGDNDPPTDPADHDLETE